MSLFESAWLLMKAIDLDDFTLDEVVNEDYVFPKGTQIWNYLKSPRGQKEMDAMRARRIDYDLEGMDLPDFQPSNPFKIREELRDLLGGSAVQGRKWDVFPRQIK